MSVSQWGFQVSIRTTPTPPSTRTGIMDRLEGGRSNVGRVAISLVRVSLSLSDCHPHTTNLFNISAPRGGGSLQMLSYKLRDIQRGSVEVFARAPSCLGAWVVEWRTYSLRYGTARAVFDKIIFRRNSSASSVARSLLRIVKQPVVEMG